MTWTADMPDRRSASDMVTWKSYVDRVFEEYRVQVAAALVAHDQQVEMNHEAASERLNSLHDHIEKIFEEKQRATEIAEREREKASQTLQVERNRATDVAEREREKAAQALSVTLAQAIREGDERLREHIQNQVEQINAALTSVEEKAIIRQEGTQQQIDNRFHYTETAVAKAEANNEKRFASVNEFRSQLSDQVTTFLPREVAEAQLEELRKAMSTVHSRLDLIQGHGTGETETRSRQQVSIGQLIGIVSLVIAFAAILVGAYT